MLRGSGGFFDLCWLLTIIFTKSRVISLVGICWTFGGGFILLIFTLRHYLYFCRGYRRAFKRGYVLCSLYKIKDLNIWILILYSPYNIKDLSVWILILHPYFKLKSKNKNLYQVYFYSVAKVRSNIGQQFT